MIINDPLLHPGWIKFNSQYWGLDGELVTLTPDKGNAWELTTVLYRNKGGAIITPPRTPYLPINFFCATEAPASYQRRKRIALNELADLYLSHDCKGSILLSSDVTDVRPFLWKNFSAQPLYTYFLNINNYREDADKRVLKQSRKAKSKGYYIEKTLNFDLVNRCLSSSEERKGFSHAVNTKGLNLLNELMTPENMHCYLLKNSEGIPVGARILLVADSYKVLAWSAGIESSALRDGANHFMIEELLTIYQNLGFEVFDFVGANIPLVAQMKENWGGQLTTYYALRSPSVRNQLISNYRYIRSALERVQKD